MPSGLTIVPLVAIGGLPVVVGALLGPETRDVEFLSSAEASDPEPPPVSTPDADEVVPDGGGRE